MGQEIPAPPYPLSALRRATGMTAGQADPLSELQAAQPDPFNLATPSVMDSPLQQVVQVLAALLGGSGKVGNPAIGLFGINAPLPAQQWAQRLLAGEAASAEAVQRAIHPGPSNRMAAEFAGMATEAPAGPPRIANPIKAWHASPYDFEKFDISKIGTGEGAQAYGHGLYFAESPAVSGPGGTYHRGFSESGRDAVMPSGNKIPQWAAHTVRAVQEGRQPASAIDDLIATFRERIAEKEARVASRASQWWNDADHIPGLRNIVAGLEEAKSGVPVPPSARAYEVNIHADPEDFLDWDAPLSQQSEKVRASIPGTPLDARGKIEAFLESEYAQLFPDATDVRIADRIYKSGDPDEIIAWANNTKGIGHTATNLFGAGGQETGGQAYSRLKHQRTSPDMPMNVAAADVSRDLQQRGIPGIKYYDAMSRGAGEGTRNYVVFDDAIIEIIRKLALLLGGPAALAAQQMQSPEREYP